VSPAKRKLGHPCLSPLFDNLGTGHPRIARVLLSPLFASVLVCLSLIIGSNVSPAHNPKSQYNLALFITESTALAGTLSLRNCARTINIRNYDRFLSQFRRLKVLLFFQKYFIHAIQDTAAIGRAHNLYALDRPANNGYGIAGTIHYQDDGIHPLHQTFRVAVG